ncbi:MAG TPA: hypothetical protein VFC78_00950 [Tepidisphaeraceae bacterium]|nr:hypothetical protein [Tepidisphaeraceae bacterium]
MHTLTRRSAGALAWMVLLAYFGSPGFAADHFLVIGGGDGPQNNQVSLEKNVQFFQRVLADTQGTIAGSDVLFSDGLAGGRGVQLESPHEVPRLNLLLARLFDRENGIELEYRRHQLTGVRGPATRRGLNEWFNSTGKKLGDGDRLLIYFTGHGGPGQPAQNTTFSMWNERPMPVSEFVGYLDRLSPKVEVMLLMVQCHAGGFAGVIFKNGKLNGELSPARRIGFFATKSDRNAAGCTPDTREEDYRDYSTYFLAALDGKTRTGKPVTGCDLDGDGRVSFAEAHAYVLIHSDTIDIPTTTSECLLRTYSKTAGEGLAKPEQPYGEVVEKASLLDRAVLEGLSGELKLTTENRYDEAKRLAQLVEAQRKTTQGNINQKNQERDRLNRAIRARLLQRWPELSNPWHPRVAKLMADEGSDIQRAIDMDSDTPRWEMLYRDAEHLDAHALDLERKWAKCIRFERMMQTVALAANIEKVANPQVLERYKEMVAQEAQGLGK